MPDRIVLQDFFGHLAGQLQQFSSAALRIEDSVGDILSNGSQGTEQLRTTLQGLDHLAQTANYLAIFVGSLSKSVDARATIDVAGHIELVGLRSLAESLVGRPPDETRTLESTGDVDLF